MEDIFEEISNRPRPNIFKRISLWWEFDGQYYPKYIKQGIKNIIYWFPIIWKDRNWDHGYIFTILRHKLISHNECISKYNLHERSQQDARRITLCIKLIDKIQDDYYNMEHMDYHKNKHWFEPCNDGTGNSFWRSENIWERYDEYFKKYPLIYKRVMNGEGNISIIGRETDKEVIAMNIAHINHDRARKLLFKIMEQNIEKWWN